MFKIKLFRMSKGLSQWEVSRDCEMSQGRYSMLERGLIEPTQNERKRLAQVLQAPASSLFRLAIRGRRRIEKILS